MIEGLKPYSAYRASGSRWLGSVPAHWEVRNLRTLIRQRNERNRPDLPLLSVAREKGVFVRSLIDADENHNVIPEDLSNYRVARAGNLVINKMKAWQGSMGIAPADGIVSPAYFVYDFAIENRHFGHALLRSKPYVAHFAQASDGVRVGQWDLTIAGMRAIPVLVPPSEEQAAIVRFLNWANGRLERTIQAKRKIIALLNERKQVIIHCAVTCGLNSLTPIAPTGSDRRILDNQLQATIRQFMQVGATVGHAQHSGDLRRYIEQGRKIIVSTVQKFPFILDEIATEAARRFAIVIDEAHSSQGGKTSAAMSQALGAAAAADEDGPDPEDTVNAALEKRMAARKMLANASYFAFTATPKNKTLEMFGEALPPDAEGKVKHRPFHAYTMKQAVEEGFILDVLKCYTPVESYYKLVKRSEDDPEFDTKKATKKLRRYVESHDHAIRLKAEIMVDHFHEQVLAAGKIGGQARAMVVTSGIERAIQYLDAFKAYLMERKSPYQAIVAFSGEHEHDGAKATEASLNGFSSADIADKIQTDPYRFLICADKFQTGYDEPLLHTMYVDKALSGIKAVQTLSRLNRAHPQKHDCFVLDFQNNSEAVTLAFQDYCRTMLLAEETDPNKLHDLKTDLDAARIYAPEQVQQVVILFLDGAERDKLDPTLDSCVGIYQGKLDEDGQVAFKSKAKVFCRTYAFLSSVIPYRNVQWEELSIFLDLLIPKLPAPKEEDLSKGILESIDMDSYRVERKVALKIALADQDAEIAPVPADAAGHKAEPELDRLSNILQRFNEQFGTTFADSDRILRHIRDDIAPKVAADPAFQNAKANTPHTARLAHDQALAKAAQGSIKDYTQFYKQFVENESFKRFVADMVFALTNE